jgi:hypothetical protein
MKKIIIGFSVIILVAFVVIMATSAKNDNQEVKKASTEMSMDCGKCPFATTCGKMAEAAASDSKACDPAKCKEGRCDPAICKAACAKGEGKKCDPAMCAGMAKK